MAMMYECIFVLSGFIKTTVCKLQYRIKGLALSLYIVCCGIIIICIAVYNMYNLYIYIYRVDTYYLGIYRVRGRGTSDRCSTKMCSSTQPFFSPVFLFGTRRKQVSPSAVVVIYRLYIRLNIIHSRTNLLRAHVNRIYATYIAIIHVRYIMF